MDEIFSGDFASWTVHFVKEYIIHNAVKIWGQYSYFGNDIVIVIVNRMFIIIIYIFIT
jgi:hypothetical protein